MAIPIARPESVIAEINVTPMVDVMLVLLIIFMVVGSVTALPVEPPEARTSVPATEDRVTLIVDRAGLLRVNDDAAPVPAGRLADRLRAAYAQKGGDDHVLYLKADANAEYARVLEALDAAAVAGVRHVGAITAAPRPAARDDDR